RSSSRGPVLTGLRPSPTSHVRTPLEQVLTQEVKFTGSSFLAGGALDGSVPAAEGLPQRAQRVVGPRLHGAGGDAEGLGRLADAAVPEVDLYQDVPVFLGQPVHGLQHHHAVHHDVGVIALDRLPVWRLGYLGRSGGPGPGPVGDDVAGDREQPAAHRTLAAD